MTDDKLKFSVGVSSGIYGAARSPELGSIVRKLGFSLTRGTKSIELAGDVPHEIDYTQGNELRYIAEKQNLTLLFHGSLTVHMCMPERGSWRDAQNHIEKSVKSAVMGGCKYVNFHSCLNYWLEMITYAGRKLSLSFCDHEGKFISDILYENEYLREWFIDEKGMDYLRDILPRETISEASSRASASASEWRSEEIRNRLLGIGLTQDQIERIINQGFFPEGREEEVRSIISKVNEEYAGITSKYEVRELKAEIRKKLGNPDESEREWESNELRAVVGVIDGYHIIAHYLYYENDPIWKIMYEMYKDVIEGEYVELEYLKKGRTYKYGSFSSADPRDVDYWLDAAWEKAEKYNDREFKEFYYSVCAAKFIEGHMKKTIKWVEGEGPNSLMSEIKRVVKDEDEQEKLKKIADELKITLEIPDARSPEYAGLYLICRPKQIYASVKALRKKMNTDKVSILIDFEHIATQGFDPLHEIREFVKLAPDAGKYILSLHVTKPTPLHHHIQVEIGDVEVYKLLWELVDKAELGKHHLTYLIYERGGERDPYKQSVTALKLMVDQLNKRTPPDELIAKPEFFGVAGPTLGSEERQRVIISEHTEDPLEGLLITTEESHTFLGRAATSKGSTPDKWKKEELK